MSTLSPSPSLLIKVASILQAIDGTPLSSPVDISSIRSQIADREVSRWLDGMAAAELIANDNDSLDDVDRAVALVVAEIEGRQ